MADTLATGELGTSGAMPWQALSIGDRFRVQSRSGRAYETTFLGCGPGSAGLYVRLEGGKLGRLSPERLRLETFERLLPDQVLCKGDEVLVTPTNGLEVRGRLVVPPTDRLTIERRHGETVSVPFDGQVPGSLRLLFRSSDLRPGDEFWVESRTGKDYRATATRVTPGAVGGKKANGEELTLSADRLVLDSLVVLIPISVAALTR